MEELAVWGWWRRMVLLVPCDWEAPFCAQQPRNEWPGKRGHRHTTSRGTSPLLPVGKVWSSARQEALREADLIIKSDGVITSLPRTTARRRLSRGR
jgi:hypothetical protein